jgi:hypothetical protein
MNWKNTEIMSNVLYLFNVLVNFKFLFTTLFSSFNMKYKNTGMAGVNDTHLFDQ